MSSQPHNSDLRNWFALATAFALAITIYRVVFLWFDQTDLFVDESQYWLWSRDLDFGYFSKPPFIAWIIRAATELAGSNAIFWVRLPAPLFHLATALILGLLTHRLFGARACFWVILSYITMPAVTLGSAVISTDTMMAPFFSLAVLFYFRLLDSRSGSDAVLAGLMVGIAFLAKYAGIYFLLCIALAAIFLPNARISWRHAATMLIAFVLVAMPNLVWNGLNGLATIEHTLDNASWVRQGAGGFSLHPLKLAEFFFSQFGVFGPILFGSLLACAVRPIPATMRVLVFLSIPIILIVCVQALLSKAYANWAAAAYFAGTVVAAAVLVEKHVRLLKLSVGIGSIAALLLPVLTTMAYDIRVDGEKPAMKRLLGREQMSLDILQAAENASTSVIVASSRDLLADLHYSGRDRDVSILAIRPPGRAMNYYQLRFPFVPSEIDSDVLLISHRDTAVCGGTPVEPVTEISTQGGALHGSRVFAYKLSPDCANDPKNH